MIDADLKLLAKTTAREQLGNGPNDA